jgi:peptidoglycan/xylan/chitin deacetylase (PgdA/CDA1 family)
MRLSLISFLACFVFTACSGQDRKLASPEPSSHHHKKELTEEDRAGLATMIEDRNETRLQQLLLGTRIAQTLVASFDLRLERLKQEVELERLLQSRLYRKIQDTRQLYESVEAKLEFVAETAYRGGPESERWFFAQVAAFAGKDVANEAAMGHLLRHLSRVRASFAPAVALPVDARSSGLRFSYDDDKAFAGFLAKNRQAIAKYSGVQPSDLEPDESFGRSPDQAGYDWSRRNWIAGNLANGEFVVTYDDGPHGSITNQLMKLWDDSGYPKPAFFWLSSNAVSLSRIVQDASRRGFPIGLHSERHPDLGNLARAGSAAQLSSVNRSRFREELKRVTPAGFVSWREQTLDREIVGAGQALTRVVRAVDPGYQLRHFRLPFGSGVRNDSIGRRLQATNMDHFFWKVDSLDWQDKSPASIHNRVVGQMRAGGKGLILFHDIQPQTVEATRLLLQTFRNTAAWQPVSIRKMVP